MTIHYQCDNCNKHCLLSANKSLDEKIPIKCPWPNVNSTDGVWKVSVRARKCLADFYLALSICQKGPKHEAEEVRSDIESA